MAGDSERFENRRIRQALERARRLHITIDGLDPSDPQAEDGSGAGTLERPEIVATAPAPPALPEARRGEGRRPPWPAEPPPASPSPPYDDGWRHRPPTGGGPGAPGTTTTASQPARRPPAEGREGADDEQARTGGWRWVDAALPDLAAAAVATGALVAPWLWLTVVAGLSLAVGVLVAGSSGVRVARMPLHGLRRVSALMHPRSLLWAPVIAVRTVFLAVLVPGAVAGAAWMLDEGAVGAPAAARAGAWTHGLRVAAALVCFMLVRGVGPARSRRASGVRRATRRLGDGALLAAAVASVALIAVVVAAGPRVDGERLSGADGLGWLPPTLRPAADRARDRIVTTELDAVATCLTKRQPTGWNRSYTTANDPGDIDVAGLVIGRGEPNPGDIATAVTAAHNQLAPWVEIIDVRFADGTLVHLDRHGVPRDRPLTDVSPLVAAASEGRSLLEDGARTLDRQTVLHCSAGPVL